MEFLSQQLGPRTGPGPGPGPGVVDGAYEGCLLFLAPPREVLQQEELEEELELELELPSWLLGVDVLSYDEGDDEGNEEGGEEGNEEQEQGEEPDLTLDAEGVLTLMNSSKVARTYFVTVENCAHIISAEDVDLLDDRKTGKRFPYLTFIVLLHPQTCADLVTLVPHKQGKSSKDKKKKKKKKGLGDSDGGRDLSTVKITSDVQEYVPTQKSTREEGGGIDEDSAAVVSQSPSFDMQVFPLTTSVTEEDDEKQKGSWLCTQAHGGHLTHFAHPSTFHAVDFRCAVGTPVLAVFAGRVLEVRCESRVTGPHASNLFSWNSILLQRVNDDVSSEEEVEELYAEYVHIHHEGIAVSEGQLVSRGQLLCLSGEAGFCPEPHLHLQISRSRDASAPSVPITYGGNPIIAGSSYP